MKKIDNKIIKVLKENAKDCLKYGYGKSYWNTLNIKDTELLNKIWNEAKEELIRDF